MAHNWKMNRDILKRTRDNMPEFLTWTSQNQKGKKRNFVEWNY